MKPSSAWVATAFTLAAAGAAAAQPAARVGDPTSHGGVIVGPGAPSVLIGGMPAARAGDFASCPLVGPGGAPHVGGPIAAGAPTVLIGGLPAARVGDQVVEVGPPSAIAAGAPTVLIGTSTAQ
jgi:uncharacterized Zn-binding protein involved in type VI secretion